jgi:hypothetical protein
MAERAIHIIDHPAKDINSLENELTLSVTLMALKVGPNFTDSMGNISRDASGRFFI